MTHDLVAIVAELARLTIQLVGRPADDRDHSEATITRRDLCLLCDAVIALSASPDLAEIERLVDAYRRVVWSNGYGEGGGRPSDLASLAEDAARSALLAAISRRVPGDLAGLLREHLAACEANDDPLGRRFESLDPKLAAWTRANLPAKETTDG